MGNSLQEQMLKAGLIDAKQAKKAKAGKPPPKKKKKDKQGAQLSDSARAAQQAQAQTAARDRELNQQRKADAEARALHAQVGQLIERHRLARDGAELNYHFTDHNKVARLLVTPAIQAQLVKGTLDIVRFDGRYDVVPADVADKIRDREPDCVMPRNASDAPGDADDPYAAYQVPDDLMW
jgi:uncharacterized protein YaiL (DUF2058 family)